MLYYSHDQRRLDAILKIIYRRNTMLINLNISKEHAETLVVWIKKAAETEQIELSTYRDQYSLELAYLGKCLVEGEAIKEWPGVTRREYTNAMGYRLNLSMYDSHYLYEASYNGATLEQICRELLAGEGLTVPPPRGHFIAAIR